MKIPKVKMPTMKAMRSQGVPKTGGRAPASPFGKMTIPKTGSIHSTEDTLKKWMGKKFK